MIELEGVRVSYAGRPPVVALAGVTLHLRPGITLVHGSSGAGKSTLLRVLAGLQPPGSGAVRYPWPVRQVGAHTGYVPQENRLVQTLAVEDALRYLAGVRGLPCGRTHVAGLVARWGLDGQRRTALCRLSAGETRRWLLAQSQLLDPDLWLLDEPLHGLDPWGMATLRHELARYAPGAGRYAIVVAHDLPLDDLATAVVWLENGRVAPL